MPKVYISDYGLLTYKEDICIPHLHLTSATKDAVMLWKRGWGSRKGSRLGVAFPKLSLGHDSDLHS